MRHRETTRRSVISIVISSGNRYRLGFPPVRRSKRQRRSACWAVARCVDLQS